ncbi:MAG: hypothetical protein L0Y57_08750, partial [Beijerinckiaceae bacterium]|nr:hypothetical protein [Beijerinckiaceae bacterium]
HDAELKQAAAALADAIGDTSAGVPGEAERADPPSSSKGAAGAGASAAALIEVVQQRLGQAEEILERKAP